MTAQWWIERLSKLDPDTEVIFRDRGGTHEGADRKCREEWIAEQFPNGGYRIMWNEHPYTDPFGTIRYE